ncbi:unnamed protein product [Schistosoma margrebowiei]|uniref:Transcription initiation factor TFIID subunit 11 n=1 Tax=Schistosoma margrebowiei TaxID=48269 RepID=A0A183MHH8_9TREM|nr:unnamed protein product [Schistosoma margrebowiei]
MDPISKSLYPINDENNSSTENWSQDPDLTDQNQVPLSTTVIQSVSDYDNQPVVEQPFKKPKLVNLNNVDSSQTKRGASNLSNIISVIDHSSVPSSSTHVSETVTNQCEVEILTNTNLLDDEETVEDDDDEEEVEEDDDEEEEEDDEDDSATVLGDADTESVVSEILSSALLQEKEARKIEDRKLLALLAHFDEEQLNRFETFRRATFTKAVVRRLIQSVAPCSVSQNVVIAMAGLTKVFIGELVEEALNYKEKLGENGPLKPKHIREAYRILSDERRCCTETPENPLL